MRHGPLVIVEDDLDDQEILRHTFKQLDISNKLIFFDRCPVAFDFLKMSEEQPFLILCDVNLPTQNGIEFKRQIDEDPQLRARSIPFVFFSTSVDRKFVDTAYKEFTVQGFFKKEESFEDLKSTIKIIVDYWKICRHPNN